MVTTSYDFSQIFSSSIQSLSPDRFYFPFFWVATVIYRLLLHIFAILPHPPPHPPSAYPNHLRDYETMKLHIAIPLFFLAKWLVTSGKPTRF